MLGSGYKQEAPPRMVLDYVPCSKCQSEMESGIACIEATNPKHTDNPPFAKEGSLSSVAPTGRWAVVRREAFDRYPVDEPLKKQIMERGKCFLQPETFSLMFEGADETVTGEGQ